MNKFKPEKITWTPESLMWIETYFPYKLFVHDAPRSVMQADPFTVVKYDMQKRESDFGEYREEWIGHCTYTNRLRYDAFYFVRLEQAKLWLQDYLGNYSDLKPGIPLSTWIRGPFDESLDVSTFEEFSMEYPHCVEISLDHDGNDIMDWLLENGMGHLTDWKAIAMKHKGVFAVYFKQPSYAVMAKLRWSGK